MTTLFELNLLTDRLNAREGNSMVMRDENGKQAANHYFIQRSNGGFYLHCTCEGSGIRDIFGNCTKKELANLLFAKFF